MAIEDERARFGASLPPWIRHEHLERFKFAARYVAGKTVVDCASGDGTGSSTFARSGAVHVHAFDLSHQAVDEAVRAHLLPNLTFQQADGCALPLADATADVFISLETIEHVPDARLFLKEIVRVLKPGGQLICSTPDRTVYNPGKPPEARPWNAFHLHEFTRDEFHAMLGEFFGGVQMFGQTPVSTPFIRMVGAAGARTSGHLAVRARQVAKLPRFVIDRPSRYAVQTIPPGKLYEYVVAVCSQPCR